MNSGGMPEVLHEFWGHARPDRLSPWSEIGFRVWGLGFGGYMGVRV